jgi:hypothetical protein
LPPTLTTLVLVVVDQPQLVKALVLYLKAVMVVLGLVLVLRVPLLVTPVVAVGLRIT